MLATTPTPRSMEERSFNLTFDDHTSHADSHSTGTSHTSSPESRPVDLQSPIPEEEEDETSSEAANEPLTPTDTLHHPTTFQDKMNGNQDVAHTLEAIRAPLIVNTAATPPSSSSGKEDVTPASQKTIPKTPVSKRDGRFKRTMSGLFGKSNPQTGALLTQPFTQTDQSAIGSDPMLGKENRRMSLTARRMSATNSPYTTRSNSPPSLASPTEEKEQLHLQVQEPSRDEFLHHNKKNRSSTGLSFRRFSKLKEKPAFPTSSNVPNDAMHRHRATSVDLDGACEQKEGNEVPMRRQPWGMAAETGSGLKARRMSLSLPDDFTVDVVELYSEYADQSKMIGRRGKTLGNGATANVALMRKKGAPSTDLYAVKEFRGKSSTENSEDYEKKVKSEYSIAKSVHHPNIVETFRLCTHNGRWNHVMEFCDQGDLFGLVNHPTHYLTKQDHLPDRLCLFKQLLQGLNYLHSNGIAHRDIKLENLLITKDSKLKITDFGVSEVFAGIHPGLRSAGGQCGQCMEDVRLCAPGICGSMPYVAPEVIAKQGEFSTILLPLHC
jgi:protein-serine/threonine kinase